MRLRVQHWQSLRLPQALLRRGARRGPSLPNHLSVAPERGWAVQGRGHSHLAQGAFRRRKTDLQTSRESALPPAWTRLADRASWLEPSRAHTDYLARRTGRNSDVNFLSVTRRGTFAPCRQGE